MAGALSTTVGFSVQLLLPIIRNLSGWTRGRLAQRVVLGRGEWRAIFHPLRPVVVKPVLTWLEALDDPVARRSGVSARVLTRG